MIRRVFELLIINDRKPLKGLKLLWVRIIYKCPSQTSILIFMGIGVGSSQMNIKKGTACHSPFRERNRELPTMDKNVRS